MATVTGGAYGNVTLSAQENGDLLQAFGWGNTVFGNGLNVTVNAGQGQATVVAGVGTDTVTQSIILGGWNNVVVGSNTTPPGPTAGANENITVFGGQGNSTVQLGTGLDNLSLAGWNNLVRLGDGNDTIFAGYGSGTIFAGNGNDLIQVSGWSDVVTLGGGSSTVSGISGSSTISAGNGNNLIEAGGWGNTISLGGGSNTVVAGAGSASVAVGGGHNMISLAGWGNLVTATGGTDTIQSGAGSDTIRLSGSNVVVTGGAHATVQLGGTTLNTVTDQQQGMVVQVGAGSPSAMLNFGADTGWVIDFVGGAGGFANVAAVEAALQNHGATTTLALGAGGSTVTFAQPIASITPDHIRIG
jgi:Ca2+-binding RTX toxin-like protein